MPLLQDLITHYKSELNDAELQAVCEDARRMQARKNFAYPAHTPVVDAQSMFIFFERVFEGQPVHLFGQNVASIAHTIIRIFRAKPDADGIGYLPADEVFAARISEKHLTEALFSANFGEGLPLTIIKLGDFDVPAVQKSDHSANLAAQELRNKSNLHAYEILCEAHSIIDGPLTRSNSELKEIAHALTNFSQGQTDITFKLDQHLRIMTEYRSQALTEAAYAALHAQKVSAALTTTQAALPPPEPADWNEISAQHPLVDSALDMIGNHYRDGLRKLTLAHIKRLSVDNPRMASWIRENDGVQSVHIPKQQDINIAIASTGTEKTELRAQIDALQALCNHAFNPHVEESRRKLNAAHGSIALSRRQGNSGNLHSSMPMSEDDSFSIRFSAAYQDHEYGSMRMRSQSAPIIEIEMTSQDLMTALRGHPDGIAIPCSMRAMAGVWRPTAARPKAHVKTDINTAAMKLKNSDQANRLKTALAAFNELVQSKRSGKAWQAELQDALRNVETALADLGVHSHAQLGNARETVNHHVAESAREMLGSISRSLPTGVLDLLLQSSDETNRLA